MLSYEEYARRVDEAVTRQWIRDNKNNLAWKHASVDLRALSPNFVQNTDEFKRCIALELGEPTLKDWLARTEDKQANADLGFEKCWYCKTMFAEPIESDAIGGHLCAGCMRWWELANVLPSYRADETADCHALITTDCIKGHEKFRQNIAETYQDYVRDELAKKLKPIEKRQNELWEKRMQARIKVNYVPSDPDNEYDTRALWALEDRERSHRDDRTY